MEQTRHKEILDRYSNALQRLADSEKEEQNKKTKISKVFLFFSILILMAYFQHLTPRIRITTKIPRTALCDLINKNDIVDLRDQPFWTGVRIPPTPFDTIGVLTETRS
jgi:hypothetical protein